MLVGSLLQFDVAHIVLRTDSVLNILTVYTINTGKNARLDTSLPR